VAKVKSRIAQVEKEAMFSAGSISHASLRVSATGRWRRLPSIGAFLTHCRNLCRGMSELDSLDRKSLIRRWEESERETSRIMRETSEHTEDEYKFYVRHGH